MSVIKNTFVILVCVLGFVNLAQAGDQGHYVGGSWSPRDLISAPAGTFALAPYLSFYHADRARNGSGKVIDGADGVSVSADALSFTPVVVYAPKAKLLGADWSMTFMPAWGQAGSAARFSTNEDNISLFDNDGQGFGDLYFVPLNLSWTLDEYWAVSTQYAYWAPVGKYTSSSTENVGLGYASHDFRGTLSYFPLGNPGILLSASVVHEINSSKQGFDLTPAPHTTAELGYSMALSESLLVGAIAFGTWETADPSGSDAKEDGRDRMLGVGVECTYWFKPGKLGAMARITKELEVRDRFEGATLTTGVNYLF